MAYFRYLIATALMILALVASVNFYADPAGVYRPDRNIPIQFAETLIRSEHGLWWPESSIEERAIKKALAKYSGNAECVVVGSSHVMQVGSARKSSSLQTVCSSIINLGVSGSVIEDHFALVYLALKRGRPKKVVLGIDPWTFAFEKDPRWSYYAEDYQQAKQAVLGDSLPGKGEKGETLLSKLRNLVSLEYTIRSVQKLAGRSSQSADRSAIVAAPVLNEAVGGEHAVFLQDGSLQYSAKYLAGARSRPIPLGGETYLTDGVLNDPAAIRAYRSLLVWIKSKGVEPVLLLTPYHQNVWTAVNSLNFRALQATESVVRTLASELGLSVIGSYSPDAVGCSSEEFFDFMHPTPECLARLHDSSSAYPPP